MTSIKEYFIKINNQFITESSDYHLSDKELYLFTQLYMDKRIDDTVITTLSVIHDSMNIPFSMQKDRNTKAIKETLTGLVTKGILNVINTDGEVADIKKMKASDTIRITFTEIKDVGHAQVDYQALSKCHTIQDFYIYTAVRRWINDDKNNGAFRCDYERFASILGVARSTAQRNIDEAVDRKIIYRNTGDYEDSKDGSQKLQELNRYKTVPFNHDEKTTMTKKKEYEEKYSPESVYDEVENEDLYYSPDDLVYAFKQWNTFEDEVTREQLAPDADAHLIALLVKRNLENRKPTKMEEKFIDKVEWRTQAMMKSPKGKEIWEQYHEDAQYELENILFGIDNVTEETKEERPLFNISDLYEEDVSKLF